MHKQQKELGELQVSMDGLERGHMERSILYEYVGSLAEQIKIKRNERRGPMADGLHDSHGSRSILNSNLPHLLGHSGSTSTAEFS